MRGVARVMVKGYDRQRANEVRASQPVRASRMTPEQQQRAIAKFAMAMQAAGMGAAVHTGPSPDGPNA